MQRAYIVVGAPLAGLPIVPFHNVYMLGIIISTQHTETHVHQLAGDILYANIL